MIPFYSPQCIYQYFYHTIYFYYIIVWLNALKLVLRDECCNIKTDSDGTCRSGQMRILRRGLIGINQFSSFTVRRLDSVCKLVRRDVWAYRPHSSDSRPVATVVAAVCYDKQGSFVAMVLSAASAAPSGERL